MSRFGLGKSTECLTLEAIGEKYGITRERVRQIENHALSAIRKAKVYGEEKQAFLEIEKVIHDMGGIIVEQDLLDAVSHDLAVQNCINFLLVLGHPFKRFKEDDDFRHRWFVDDQLANQVHESLKKVYKALKEEDILSEQDMIRIFVEHIKDMPEKYKSDEVIKRWLSVSKLIGRNPLGEWGKSQSPNIRTKGMRDYAFLVIRRHGSPIHFRDVAKAITETFGKKAHIATTHNELIKDPRFVLVGRGLYALAEWGYMSGVVKDVIKKLIEKHGPMTKDEIIEKVMKERYVKENTILVNLSNSKAFKRGKDGKYAIV